MPKKKTPLIQALDAAKKAGAYMVAVWRVEGGQLHYFRETVAFPPGDFEPARVQLENDLRDELTALLPKMQESI